MAETEYVKLGVLKVRVSTVVTVTPTMVSVVLHFHVVPLRTSPLEHERTPSTRAAHAKILVKSFIISIISVCFGQQR